MQSFSPHTAHPSTPTPHPSPRCLFIIFIMFGSSYPCHQDANQFTRTAVTLPCIYTELQHINFADLFSTGSCLCTFHLNCTFVPGSCENYTSAWGLAISCSFKFFFFLFLFFCKSPDPPIFHLRLSAAKTQIKLYGCSLY